MSFEVATWVSAIATVILAAFAVFTVRYAKKAFLKQSQEIGLLLKQNKRDTQERRRSQAARVFLGAPYGDGPGLVKPYARNASDFPVYETEIWYVVAGEVDDLDRLGVLLPGETRSASRPLPADIGLDGLYLLFRDAEGIYWTRTPLGRFYERRRVFAPDEIRAVRDRRPESGAQQWEDLPLGYGDKAATWLPPSRRIVLLLPPGERLSGWLRVPGQRRCRRVPDLARTSAWTMTSPHGRSSLLRD